MGLIVFGECEKVCIHRFELRVLLPGPLTDDNRACIATLEHENGTGLIGDRVVARDFDR